MPIGLDDLWHGHLPVRWWLILESTKALSRHHDGWDVLTGPIFGIGSADLFTKAFEKEKINLGMRAGTV